MTPNRRDSSGAVVVGPVVVLHGETIDAALDAVLRVAHARRRNGHPPSRHHVLLAEALNSAMAAAGHQGDTTKPSVPQHQTHELPTLPLAEAARRLGLSLRHTRRLAPALGGQLIAGRWFVSETAVTEHLEGLTWKETE